MRAAVLEARERLVVRDLPAPVPEKDGLLLRVRACGVCGTDRRVWRYGHPRVSLPQVLGHEIAGELAEVGSEVADYQPGERVVLSPKIPCGACRFCREVSPIFCENRRSFGYQLPGGFAEYLRIPAEAVRKGLVHRFGAGLSFPAAALSEPLSCVLHAQQECRIRPGESLVIIGGGPMGILHGRLAKSAGISPILIEIDDLRLRRADRALWAGVIDARDPGELEKLSAGLGGRGADTVIVAASAPEAQTLSVKLSAVRGRISFFAGLPPGQGPVPLDTNAIHYRELRVLGSHGSTAREHREALGLLERRTIQADDLVSSCLSLEDVEEAFRKSEKNEGLKVMILP